VGGQRDDRWGVRQAPLTSRIWLSGSVGSPLSGQPVLRCQNRSRRPPPWAWRKDPRNPLWEEVLEGADGQVALHAAS
jgi:hypothetical protein